VIYLGGYTSSPDFPVTESAIQKKLQGTVNGFLSAINWRSGKLIYSTYLGGNSTDNVTALAVAQDGSIYVAGVTQSTHWPTVTFRQFGNCGDSDGFIIKLDLTGRSRSEGIRIGGSGNEDVAALDIDSEGDLYVAGSTDSRNFPQKGAEFQKEGSGFVLKIAGLEFSAGPGSVKWSRRIGGRGDDALLALSAKMPGSIFATGRSSSRNFPTTPGAFYRNLSAQNDSVLVRLTSSTGRLQFATFISGTQASYADWHNDAATGVRANASGDVYVTGYTIGDRLPVTPAAPQPKRKGNTEAFALRMKFGVQPRKFQ
jgi:hypothetical protein